MKKLPYLAAALLLCAGAAQAEDGAYFGLGLGYSSMESDCEKDCGAFSNLDTAIVGLTFGYREDKGTGFLAGEIDADLSGGGEFIGEDLGRSCYVGALAPYYCKHNSTIRLRGVAGTELSPGFEMFGSLGLAVISGESAVAPNAQASITSTGFTIGAGLQHSYPTGATGRIELIYDEANQSDEPDGFTPTYNAWTLKASYLF